MKFIKVQYASNLMVDMSQHIYFSKMLTPANAPILCLLGGIGSPKSSATHAFMNWCSLQWNHVLWVPGHTELIGGADKIQRCVSDFKNIHIMTNKSWSYTNNGAKYVFLGTSNMNRGDDSWLDGHIEEANEMEEKVVCLTYSPPIISSGLIRKPVCAWLHGQTIDCVRSSVGNIPILSNSFANVMNPCYSPKKSVVILQ
jgi:hypothetical protein